MDVLVDSQDRGRVVEVRLEAFVAARIVISDIAGAKKGAHDLDQELVGEAIECRAR